MLDSVDCDVIVDRICFNILIDIESGYKLFEVNLVYMRFFC